MGIRPNKNPWIRGRGGFYQPPRTDGSPPRPNVRRQPTPPTGARSLAETLLAKHRSQGIPQPCLDVSQVPEVPEDITSLSDQDLSTMYGRLDAFASFVGYKLAEAEVCKLEAGRLLKDLEARMTLDGLSGVKKGDITRKRMEVFLEPELSTMRETEVYHTAEVKLLKARYEGIERTIRVLSRDQSRRETVNGRRNYSQP